MLSVALRHRGQWDQPDAKNVQFELNSPGGCGPASFTIPGGSSWAERLGTQTWVTITDTSTARRLWDGFVAAADPDGADLRVTCDGSLVKLSDRFWRLPYLSTRLDAWERDGVRAGSDSAKVEQTSVPWVPDLPAIAVGWPPGATVDNGDKAVASFTGFENSPMTLGAFYGWRACPIDSAAEYWTDIYLGDPQFLARPHHQAWTRNAVKVTFTCDGSNQYAPPGSTWLQLESSLFGGGPKANLPNPRQAYWYSLRVQGARVDRRGVPVSVDPNEDIDPVDVVEDLIGRCLIGIVTPDETRSPRMLLWGDASTMFKMPVLDYSNEPVTPREILDDITSFNADWTYFLGPGGDDDMHGLHYKPWGSADYVLPEDAPIKWGVTADLYNKVTVTWVNSRSRRRYESSATALDVTRYPDAAVSAMGGRVRELPPIDLPESISSLSAAARVRDQVLDLVARASRGGELLISEPLVAENGLSTPPVELQPGIVVATADGTPERVTRVVVDGDSETATLTLSSPRRTVEGLLADSQRKRWRRKRI